MTYLMTVIELMAAAFAMAVVLAAWATVGIVLTGASW